MPAVEPHDNDTETKQTDDAPRNPLEALRRAQANRSLPPGSQPHGGGKASRAGGGGKAPRMYNRHK